MHQVHGVLNKHYDDLETRGSFIFVQRNWISTDITKITYRPSMQKTIYFHYLLFTVPPWPNNFSKYRRPGSFCYHFWEIPIIWKKIKSLVEKSNLTRRETYNPYPFGCTVWLPGGGAWKFKKTLPANWENLRPGTRCVQERNTENREKWIYEIHNLQQKNKTNIYMSSTMLLEIVHP